MHLVDDCLEIKIEVTGNSFHIAIPQAHISKALRHVKKDESWAFPFVLGFLSGVAMLSVYIHVG